MADLILNKELAVLPTSQAGAPGTTPGFVGATNVNSTSGDIYIAKAASAASDWVLMSSDILDTQTTTDATPAEVTDITAAANTVYLLKYRISAANSDNSKAYVSTWDVGFISTGLLNDPVGVEFKLVSGDTMSVAFSIDTAHLKVNVTGMGSVTLHWNIAYKLYTFAY